MVARLLSFSFVTLCEIYFAFISIPQGELVMGRAGFGAN